MAVSPIASILAQALLSVDPALAVRPENDADFPFIIELYADTRYEELAPVPWPDEAKRDFLASQCRLQRDHYAKHYRDSELLLIERAGTAIGRIYLHVATSEIRLMDIALLRDHRGIGIGRALLGALQGEAGRRKTTVTLHVEPGNPAQRLYQRLGFRLVENRGAYDFLSWTASSPLS